MFPATCIVDAGTTLCSCYSVCSIQRPQSRRTRKRIYSLVRFVSNVAERVKCQTACKPGSVPPRYAGRGWPFLWDARYRAPHATYPSGGAKARPAPGNAGCLPLLLGLAPGGVFPAAAVAGGAVRSYRTISPLPPAGYPRDRLAVCFLWHFPWGCPRRALPGTVPPWSPDFPLPARQRRAAIRPSAYGIRWARMPAVSKRRPGRLQSCDGGSPGMKRRRRKASQNKSAVIASRTSAAANASGAASPGRCGPCSPSRATPTNRKNRPAAEEESRRSALRSGRRSLRRQCRFGRRPRTAGTPTRTATPRSPGSRGRPGSSRRQRRRRSAGRTRTQSL